jgi:hypothetical protein
MNAQLCRPSAEVEPPWQELPDASLRRLWPRLGRGLASGEAWDVGLLYGVCPDRLARVAEHWLLDCDPYVHCEVLWELTSASEQRDELFCYLLESPLEALAFALATLGKEAT